ncbi:MAG: hypothetical protein BJG00_009125 [Limnothrix sp. CACIAM 69d]|nr:MAG: hypothetical protein BJG00_009125 [Limnothrix sp. CACIAM 69d]
MAREWDPIQSFAIRDFESSLIHWAWDAAVRWFGSWSQAKEQPNQNSVARLAEARSVSSETRSD